jgi:hypothetical protein
MRTQGNYRLRMLISGATAALASCLLALALAAPPAQAATQPGDLSVSQSGSPDPLESGYLTYTLTVKHELVDRCGGHCYYSGPVEVEDTLPSGVELDEIVYPTETPGGHDVSVSCTGSSTVACTVDDLHDSDSAKIDLLVRVTTAGARTLTNTATVRSAEGAQDPDTANNTSTATTRVSEAYTPFPDTKPPETTLTQTPEAFSDDVSPRFSFKSDAGNTTFECKIDTAAFQSCASPKQYFVLSEGQHTFEVRATDSSGNVDATPSKHAWTVDSLSPKINFTERPGNPTGPRSYDDWITNDKSPTWAWTIEDANRVPAEDSCYLYDDTNDRYILNYFPCSSSSPYTFGGDLPDGHYYFNISTEDKAGNYDSIENDFEVDTAPLTVVSHTPTGTRVSPGSDVVVTFDDHVYDSKQFVNIYKGASDTPLAVYRYYGDGDKKVEIDPRNSLKRGTRYTVKVAAGANDGANNLETPHTWSFRTKP